jgi:hypothetical protein
LFPLAIGHEIGFASRDKLDCRLANLRVVPHGTNIRNGGKRTNNTSGVKCVVRHTVRSSSGRLFSWWRGRITIGPRGETMTLANKYFEYSPAGLEAAGEWVNEQYLLHFPEVKPPN